MPSNDSTVKFKADISQLKAEMQAASRQVRLANSEFKAATSGMDDWSSSADGLQKKIDQLTSVLEAQKKQAALANEEWEKTVKVYGENSAEADRAKIKLNNYEAAVNSTEKELGDYRKQLENVEDSTIDLEDATEKASDGFTVMKGALANLVADGIRVAIDAVKDFIADTIEVGQTFEKSMSNVQALSGATADELKLLSDTAKEFGSSTQFSASEAADALGYMALAGWDAQTSASALGGVLDLAAASGMDLAEASDMVTDYMSAFNMKAEDSAYFADLLAYAQANANTTTQGLGEAFKNSAANMNAAGQDIETTVSLLSMMANQGLKGSEAGTALTAVMRDMTSKMKKGKIAIGDVSVEVMDANGNYRDMTDILQDVSKATDGMGDAEKSAALLTTFTSDSIKGLNLLLNAGVDEAASFEEQLRNSAGAASDMAKVMNDNLTGDLTALNSQIEGTKIQIYESLEPALRKAVASISESISAADWDSISQAIGDLAVKAADLFSYVLRNGPAIVNILKNVAAVMGTVFVVNKVGTFIGWLNNLIAAYSRLNSITAVLKTTQLGLNAAQLASPVGLVVAGIAALAGGMAYAYTKTKDLAEAEYGLSDAEKELNNSINSNWEAQKQLNEIRDQSIESTTGEFNYIEQLKDEYNTLINSNGEVKKGYEDRANFILNELANALGVEIQTIKDEYTENGKLSASIDELIQKKQAEATLSAYEDTYRNAKSNEAQALEEAITAQNNYTDAKQKYLDVQAQYDEVEKKMEDAMLNGQNYNIYAGQMAQLTIKLGEAKQAFDENKTALDNANKAYVDGQTTIKNYEGLSAAIISGDVSKINTELGKLTSGFKDAKSSTQQQLEAQVKDYENYYSQIKQAMENGSPIVTQQMVNDAKNMVDKAKAELDKFSPQAEESADNAVNSYVDILEMGTPAATRAGEKLKEAVKEGTDNPETAETGEKAATEYNVGIEGQLDNVKAEGKKLPEEAKKGADTKDETTDSEKSGSNFGEGFFNGIGSWLTKIWERGKELAQNAVSGAKAGQQEGSPSKLTYQSGQYFGEGYANGIKDTTKQVVLAATNMAKKAVQAEKDAQQEGSPSKLTYQSGRNFTQGFINGISSLEKSLVSTTKNMVNKALKELLNLDNFNFSDVASNASTAFSKAISKQMEYMSGWLQYQNQQMLADFDSTIDNLQDASDSAVSKATTKSETKQAKIQAKIDKITKIAESKRTKKQKKQLKKLQKQLEAEQKAVEKNTSNIQSQYQSQIEEQQAMKEAYQQASSSMMSEFTSAMNEYATAAQQLIDDTMNGISSTYQSQYDALVNKQDNLIQKLQSAGDLFNVSSANVMTINDIQAQTAAIKQYASKLQEIKSKVSSDLFDQIAQYDMQQGEAFIDRLLAMSDAELKAYSDAYDEKLNVSEQLAESIYQSDFDKVADEYEKAMQEAFKNLPSQLETLGYQTMQGFLSGLTTNTDYMSSAIKTFVSGMVDQFKSQLGIHSPSKVAMSLGAFTGEGFADGLLEMVKTVKKAAQEIADTVSSSLDWNGDMTSARSIVSSAQGNSGLNRNAGSFAGNTQIINFNQTNNSPKALDRLTLYRQTNNMLFSAKVRLSDV